MCGVPGVERKTGGILTSMNSKDDLSYRFHIREQTIGRDLGTKNREKARRSFFKYVCKHELYYPLFFRRFKDGWYEHFRSESPHIKSYYYGTMPPAHGYPVFRSWRSQAYDGWQGEFEKHRERWLKEEHEKWWQERSAADRENLHQSSAADTFRILAVAGAIKHG